MPVGAKYSESGGQLGILFTERRIFDLDRNVVKELYPTVAPFTTFITKLRSETVNDADYKMFEHRSKWIEMKFNVNSAIPPTWTAQSDGSYVASNVPVDDGAATPADVEFLVVGLVVDIFANNAGSYGSYKATAVITSVDNTAGAQKVTLKTVNKPSSAPTALADNDFLYVIGNAHEEGSGAPEAWSDELEIIWNSTQIMKTPVEITGTLLQTALRGYSNELARLRKEKAMEHKMLKNKYFLLGRRANDLGSPSHVTGANGRPIRLTMGFIPIMETYGVAKENYFQFTKGGANYDSINTAFEAIFSRVNERGVKYGFASPDVITWFTGAGSGTFLGNTGVSLQVQTGLSRFGYPVKVIETGHGDLVLAKDITLRGPYKGNLAIIDPQNIGHKVFRNPKYETAIQLPDEDLVKDQYISDEGLYLTLKETHALMQFT